MFVVVEELGEGIAICGKGLSCDGRWEGSDGHQKTNRIYNYPIGNCLVQRLPMRYQAAC
jgi:hypothetical protein